MSLRAVCIILGASIGASAQDFSTVSIEKLVANQQFTDGPVWSPDGSLFFCDVPANRIFRLSNDGLITFRENSPGAGGLAWDQNGRLYIAESRSKRVVRVDKKGKLEVVADSFEGKPFNGPNDLVVSRNGHVYFTDPAFGAQQDGKQLPYAVYHVTPKGELERTAQSPTRPNGIALSLDGKLLYVADADSRLVRSFSVGKEGKVADERVFVSDIDGPPAGLKLDEKGNLYVAARGIAIYSPQGQLLHTIPLSEKPSNFAFGDGDLQTLYVTARSSVYKIRMPVKGALPH